MLNKKKLHLLISVRNIYKKNTKSIKKIILVYICKILYTIYVLKFKKILFN